MKKHLLFIIAIMVLLLPSTVFGATEITQTNYSDILIQDTVHGSWDIPAEGEYVLGSDLNIGNTNFFGIYNNVVLDLNGHTLSCRFIYVFESTLTIQGNGNVIGTSEGGMYTQTSTVIIENVTFEGSIKASSTNLTINNGTFRSINETACLYIGDRSEVTINNGTFEEVDVQLFDAIESAKSLEINGGTFTGPAGLYLNMNNIDKVTLAGGTFTGTNDNWGAILIGDSTDGHEYNTILKDGYEYSPELIITEDIWGYKTQSMVKVIKSVEPEPKPVPEEEKKEETKNPKTGDSIIAYISLFIISSIGLIIIKRH